MIWMLLFGALLLKASSNGQEACTPIADFESSTLTSPGYPGEYANDLDTCTTIYGNIITLTFTDFDLESHDTCGYDYVAVTDSSGTELGKWCGENYPTGLENLAGPVTVTFHTDHSVIRRGFSYNIDRVNDVSPGQNVYQFQYGPTCTVIPQSVNTLTSPGFPGQYPDGFEGCIEIYGDDISLDFQSFDLEAHSDCIYDYFAVEIDGEESARWCDTNSPGSLSYQGPIVLRFRTDGSVVRNGFQLTLERDCVAEEAGLDYLGTRSVTENGIECQRWDTDTPHVPWSTYTNENLFLEGSLTAAENYCRNPGNDEPRPWCYTIDPEVRWELCDIPLCTA